MSRTKNITSSSRPPRSALASAATPRTVRFLARLLFITFLAAPFALALVPWQQTVQGQGMVVAYAPVDRMQVITARVSGQIRRWHVVEGTRVKMNDPVVDIEDNDPELAKRLEAQRGFLAERLVAARLEVAEVCAGLRSKPFPDVRRTVQQPAVRRPRKQAVSGRGPDEGRPRRHRHRQGAR